MKNKVEQFFFIIICFINTSFSWPLDSTLARGDSCVNISWTPDSTNTDPSWYIHYGTQCTGTDSVYLHCDFIPEKPYKGIAYSYGGEDPWYLFRDRVDSGYFVGSHMCHYNEYGDPSDTIAGTDCSGFLCFIWNVPRMSTGGIIQSSLFDEIDKNDLQAGDGLVRGGYHCVFVVEADDPSEIVIWEASSSVFGCRERVTDINNSYWNTYTALRYPEITNIINNYKKSPKSTSDFISMRVFSNGKISVNSLYSKRMHIRVHNTLGQLIRKTALPAYAKSIEINNHNSFSKGIYFISVSINNHLISKKRIMLYK